MRPFLYTFLLVLWGATALLAQQNNKGWQELTISDGLSQGMIFDLLQDEKGFIWVATKDGLNRYDGHNFTVFTHDPYNEYSLSDNNCSALLLDSRGWLWVGTLNTGLNLFDRKTQRFYHIDIHDKTAANAGNYGINKIYEDPRGNIWVVANENKLIKISLPDSLKVPFPVRANGTKEIQIFQLPTAFRVGDPIKHLSFRADGQAVAVCKSGAYAFNWQYPQKPGRFSSYSDNEVGLYSNLAQQISIALRGERLVCQFHHQQKTIHLVGAASNPEFIPVITAFDPKTLAIATDKYLWLMSPDELVRQDSLTADNAFVALPPDIYAVTTILRDQTGNVWLGTSGYGLRIFNPRVKQFHTYLPNTTLSHVYTDRQGRTYVRYEFAYKQLDRDKNRMKPFLDDKLTPAQKRARYLMQDRQGTFWVSNTNFETQEMSLLKFSSDWKLLKKYALPPNTSFNFYINQTVEDASGRLWIGVLNGKLLRFDPETETFQVFTYQALLPQKGADIETNVLFFDRNGTLWIGTSKGLVRADHPYTTPSFSLYKNDTRERTSLSDDLVSSLLDDPNQPTRYLWVGTKGGGLNRLDKQTGRFGHITEAQGLPNKVVYGILSDEFRNLWLSTNRGLARFNPRTQTFLNFTKADGLQDDEFNSGSFFKAPSGELLFGGVRGLTIFRASNIAQSVSKVPQVQLIDLKINNERVRVGGASGILTEGVEYTRHIDLTHTQNLITLEFGVMDFANSAKNRYRYRLSGIDDDWVDAGTNRFANYAQLPPGKYTFQVMGSVDGQSWSQPVTLAMQVHPPFYQTWWAYLLYAVILVIIGWQLYKFQTQRLLLEQRVAFEQKEASRLAELDGLKTQFFTNISHEFRTPLTLILGPLADLKQRFPAETILTVMERNGNRLLSLINQLLDLSKLEAGQLKAELVTDELTALFHTLSSSFTSLAESRQISFVFEQSETRIWAMFDRDKLEKIVVNLLSNAFKFTPKGNEVRMSVHYSITGESGMLTLTVQDTGIGIAPEHLARIFERFYQVNGQTTRSHEGTGIGLALVNELVKVLKGTIDVVSAQGAGTTFTVTLPFVPAVAPEERAVDAGTTSVAAYLADRPEPVPLPSAGRVSEEERILLIVDDNADIRAYVRRIFDGEYRVMEATDGREGLELATSVLPDIVICDLMMPRLDGFGFCRALKSQEATSHIPVIMLTAKATVDDRIDGFDRGGDDYLTKPFNQMELEARVRNLIRQRERLFQAFARQNRNRPPTEVAPTDVAPTEVAVPALPTAEQLFLDRLSTVVDQHLDDASFTVEDLAEAVHLSRVQLHRKLKAVASTTATQFIRDIRLARAAQLLTENRQSVTQIAYAVGFDNLSYFSKVFQERYGVSPSQYTKSQPSVF
ncbi:ATP-binding protein [Spirosoma sp. KUDC1026]|uniref:hybrid sensor histidine kinase/response regulator transcription factor n=1 Tax=Spirosoma sp. KUDC1026 TaxID=2745947 RepID=UPI00159BC393|nr:ATP-binding protein [Spirosoma sp. KUDC1026]QKZ14740.1 response regulator [Spirosoma sp. KUDC1026]